MDCMSLLKIANSHICLVLYVGIVYTVVKSVCPRGKLKEGHLQWWPVNSGH